MVTRFPSSLYHTIFISYNNSHSSILIPNQSIHIRCGRGELQKCLEIVLQSASSSAVVGPSSIRWSPTMKENLWKNQVRFMVVDSPSIKDQGIHIVAIIITKNDNQIPSLVPNSNILSFSLDIYLSSH